MTNVVRWFTILKAGDFQFASWCKLQLSGVVVQIWGFSKSWGVTPKPSSRQKRPWLSIETHGDDWGSPFFQKTHLSHLLLTPQLCSDSRLLGPRGESLGRAPPKLGLHSYWTGPFFQRKWWFSGTLLVCQGVIWGNHLRLDSFQSLDILKFAHIFGGSRCFRYFWTHRNKIWSFRF